VSAPVDAAADTNTSCELSENISRSSETGDAVVTSKTAAATSDLCVIHDTTEQQANQLALGNTDHNTILLRITQSLSLS